MSGIRRAKMPHCSPTTAIISHNVLCIASILILLLALTGTPPMAAATSAASGHSADIDNVLHDKAASSATSSDDAATTMRDIMADDANDDDTSVELLRFVDDNEDASSASTEERSDDEEENEGFAAAKKATTTKRSSAPSLSRDNNHHQSNNGVNHNKNNNDNKDDAAPLDMESQVRLLSKQLNALMTRRSEDYELLERSLRKSLRITTNAATIDTDIRGELEQLRHEVQSLRENHPLSANKERITIEWLQQSVAELRKQLVELQQLASGALRDVQRHTQNYEDLATIRNDFQQVQLELVAMKERQQRTEVFVQELREETMQQEEDYKRLLINRAQEKAGEDHNLQAAATDSDTAAAATMLADHKRRHHRYQSEQIHQLQVAQHHFKRQLNELKYNRIGERVHNMEIEQRRLADANFNLSRQISTLDRLHQSVLELLEDVETLQNKMDKSIPDVRHEISKLEFSNAQLQSELNANREEGKNLARSVQAMAVSVSTLQDEREGIKRTQSAVGQMQARIDRLQSMTDDVQRAVQHRRNRENQAAAANAAAAKSNHYKHAHNGHNNNNDATADDDDNNGNNVRSHNNANDAATAPASSSTSSGGTPVASAADFDFVPMTQHAESLVAKLESVEQQYESIIEKLPQDCGDVATNGNEGLYMIAPSGQHRPLMAHCSADGWTLVQRRFDGSADFNRSWEDYATGFGTPAGEYWMGNEQLHHLTASNCSGLRVIMQDIYDNIWLADYKRFVVSSRSDGYRLHVTGYKGNASDALDYQQGMQFSAIDVDRDISQTHCAANYEGGWWFSHCQHANLNGRYNLGLTWFDAARNEWIAVKSSQMLVRRHAAGCDATAAANGGGLAAPLSSSALANPAGSEGAATSAAATSAATATATTTTRTTTGTAAQSEFAANV